MPTRTPRLFLTQLSRRLPLRAVLIIPFVLQILAVVGLTGYLSYRNGRHAVQDLVNQLEQEVGNRIEQKLETYLTTSKIVNQINVDATRLGLLNLEDMEALERYLWSQFKQFNNYESSRAPCSQLDSDSGEFNNLTLIAIATETGSYIDLGCDSKDELGLRIRDLRKDNITRIWELNDWGNRTRQTGELKDYDPRQRPWYQAAVQAGRLVLVDPYLTYADEDLIISADSPLYDSRGNLLGVADATLSLSGISGFLRSLKIGQTGQTFIVQPNGDVIATSTSERPFLGQGEQTERLNVLKSSNELTRKTATYLTKTFGNLGNINQSQELEFWANGQRQFVKVQPFPNTQRSSYQGLDWLVVIVIPEADFMAQIQANTRITILLCGVALVVAIVFGILTSRWLTKPILQLSKAAESLAKGDWDQSVPVERSGELGTLANAFNHMRQELKHSHYQLEKYSRGLEQKNEQLRTLEAELRRQLNLFLHAVSHDLRNPVLGTGMVLNNLKSQPGNELMLPRKVLERMLESNQRQLDLINSLIDTHAAEIWGITLHPQTMPLNQLVASAIADLQPIIDREQTIINNQVSPELPLVNIDPLQLARVYQNLLANALKHNPPGLTITLNAHAEGNWVHCTVTDNGVGISPEQCEKLFDPYFRGEQRPKSVGLGLGLYLCQQIIQAHGGVIGVQSQPNQGTSFWFTLPLTPSPTVEREEVEVGHGAKVEERSP